MNTPIKKSAPWRVIILFSALAAVVAATAIIVLQGQWFEKSTSQWRQDRLGPTR